MDEPILVVISLTMFVGSYLAGCIPLFFTLNERRIRVASIFGAGLLVGTALCVIIPEGISALMESSRAASHQHGFPNTPERLPPFNPPIIDGSAEKKQPLKVKKEIFLDDYKRAGGTSFEPKEVPSMERSENRQHQVVRRSVGTLTKREVASAVQENAPTSAEHGHDGDKKRTDNEMNLDKPIGVSLLIGFLFMFVVDQLAKMTHGRNKSLSTLGLVIHAFADGIAMGSASSAGNQMEMQILVFVAIMLHKAPAAFALVSILLAQGLEKVRIRRHLLAFSLAAPIGTLLPYALLHTQSQIASVPSSGAAEEESPSRITGLILLFSAGTFLYIATVHVLPELIESKCNNSSSTHGGMSGSRELLLGGGHSSGSLVGPISRLSLFEICLFCVSALIPAFISSASHGHGH